ncbi:hypothetical protein [Dethiothermospora halolimnae]|uniref:hypothetical protein n=1 Tax=Dethiothermospora halolimnae TaxID=3114390 RepID=UPI003CCB7D1B
MKKLILTVIIICIATSTSLYADNFDKKNKNEEGLVLENGDVMPIKQSFKEPYTGKSHEWNLFEITDGDALFLKLMDREVYMRNGQHMYTTTNNKGDYTNYSPLKKPENLYDMLDVYMNTYNHTGGSYIHSLKRKYPLKYPADSRVKKGYVNKPNWNFKDTTGDLYNLVIDNKANSKKQFWSDGSIAGNWRYSMSYLGQTQGNFAFTRDVGKGAYSIRNSIIAEPWKLGRFGIVEGAFNKRFKKEFEQTGKVGEKWQLWYSTFKAFNNNLENVMQQKCRLKGLNPTLQNQTKMFFKYFSVISIPSYNSYGKAYEIHYNGRYYSGIQTPRFTSLKNLRIASKDYPIGNYNTVEIIDKETGKKLNPETDILKAGQEITQKFFVGFENSQGEEGTYNKGIKINNYIFFNNNKDYSHADDFVPLIESENHPRTSLKRVAKDGFRVEGDNINLDNPKNIAIYKIDYTVPEYTEDGNPLKQITFTGQFPYQKNYYRSTDQVKNDNQKKEDDESSITFKVEPKNPSDLIITEFKLLDDEGNTITKEQGVERNKSYKAYIKIKNVGKNPTNNIINSGLVNNLESQYFGIARDSTIGDIINPETPKILQPQEESEYVIDIHIPLELSKTKLILTSFIPNMYDGIDNVYIKKDDVRRLEFPINGRENLAITALKLYSTDGELFNTKNPDSSTYFFKPTNSYPEVTGYDVYVKMEKTDGEKEVVNPEVNLYIKRTDGSIETKTLTVPITLNKNNRVAEYWLRELKGVDFKFDLLAQVPKKYKEMGLNDYEDDDSILKIYKCVFNLVLRSFEVNPPNITLAEDEYSKEQSFGYTAKAHMESDFPNLQNVDNVKFIVLIDGKAVRINNNKKYDLVHFNKSGSTVNINGKIDKRYVREGNHSVQAIINADKQYIETKYETDGNDKNGGPSGFRALPYKDNWKGDNFKVIKHKPDREQEFECEYIRKRINWGPVTFYYHKGVGGVQHSKTVQTENGSKTIKWCDPYAEDVIVHGNDEYDKSFYETFEARVMFASPSTGGRYVDITGRKGKVIAGQWFDFYIETEYYTNRDNMPPPSPHGGVCGNVITRSPGYVRVPSSPPSMEDYSVKGAGLDIEKHYARPYYRKGSSSHQIKRFRPRFESDDFGETNNRIYTDERAVNNTIKITYETEEFKGYVYDRDEHPQGDDAYLQSCGTGTIEIVDPLPIKSQIINN